MYWEFPVRSQQAVRMGRWKGYREGTKSPLQLFDLTSDPAEKNNIAGKHPQIVQQMESIMAQSHTSSKFWPLDSGNKKGKMKR